MRYSKYNIVIIGSGISGLYLANKLSENNNLKDGVLLVTKEQMFSGSSALAQGGIVSVIPEINPTDSIESHVKDTIKAGCGLNDLNIVKLVSEESAKAVQELIRFGVEFDRNEKHGLNFTLEGAHSCPRILHSQGDSTGRVIEEALTEHLQKSSNVELYDNTMAVELLVDSNKTCRGVVTYNWKNNYYEAIYSNNVIIATGGIGQIFKNTTNPAVSTGDGISIAYKAGAEVRDMEFVQFHPTALYCKDKASLPLVSESARGEGGKLVTNSGNYFAKNYHHMADLAPRDIVARAIMDELEKNQDEHVNLDISKIGIENFRKRFPTITSLCEENNIDISTGLIPVKPAEHYFMGGIKVDATTQTTIKNLYAIGECACTGLHGANRLASNSLLECAVFAQRLYEYLTLNPVEPPKKHDEKVKNIVDKYSNQDFMPDTREDFIKIMFDELKQVMTDNTGIVRSESSLKKALNTIEILESRIDEVKNDSRIKYEFINAVQVAKLVTLAALNRKNSIGAHFRADYPQKSIEPEQIKDGVTINHDEILA